MQNPPLLALYDQDQRIGIQYPEARKEILSPAGPLSPPSLVRLTRPAPGINTITYSRIPESALDSAIQAQIDHFLPLGQPFEWIVCEHDQPASIKQRLEAHGFQAGESEPVLVLDLQEAPPVLLSPVSADVRKLSRPEELSGVIQVMEHVYGGSFGWIHQRLGHHLQLPGFLSVYIAYAAGRPACAAWIYFHPRSHFASLWGGSTVAEHRRQGLYTALLALRAQEAIRRGYRYLTINASDMSLPIVSKYGFQLLVNEWSYQYTGKQEETP